MHPATHPFARLDGVHNNHSLVHFSSTLLRGDLLKDSYFRGGEMMWWARNNNKHIPDGFWIVWTVLSVSSIQCSQLTVWTSYCVDSLLCGHLKV